MTIFEELDTKIKLLCEKRKNSYKNIPRQKTGKADTLVALRQETIIA